MDFEDVSNEQVRLAIDYVNEQLESGVSLEPLVRGIQNPMRLLRQNPRLRRQIWGESGRIGVAGILRLGVELGRDLGLELGLELGVELGRDPELGLGLERGLGLVLELGHGLGRGLERGLVRGLVRELVRELEHGLGRELGVELGRDLVRELELELELERDPELGLEPGLGLGLVVLHYVTMAVVLGALVYLDERDQPSEEADSELVVAPLIRVTTFVDQRAEAVAIAACEEILRILEPFRDQGTSPLGQEQLNRLDASCRTIEAQMRSPNVAILSAAIEDAISVVRPFLEFADEPRSEAARNVVDATTGIGDIDPAVSGEHSRDALQHAVDLHVPDVEHDPEVPPTNTTEPSESTETSSDNQSFSDQARERARAGVLEGIQELSKRVIVNGPSNAATITAIVGAWLTQPPQSAAGVSVAIAVIKFLLGANKRK